MNRTILPVMLISTALVLGACGQAPVTQQQTPTNTGKLVAVKVSAPLGQNAAKLGPQALPGDGTGMPVVNLAKLKVYKHDGEARIPVSFNADNVFDPEGKPYVKLTPENPWQNIMLPAGDYDMEVVGLVDSTPDDGEDTGAFLAYDTTTDYDGYGVVRVRETGDFTWGSDGDDEVDLHLHTLVDPAASSLQAFTPRNVVTTDEQISLRLNLRTKTYDQAPPPVLTAVNGPQVMFAAGSSLPVPSYDYEVQYGFDANIGGTFVSEGNAYGVKVKTPDSLDSEMGDLTQFVTNAHVEAWVETGPEKAEYKKLELIQYKVALANPASFENDLTPPTVTFAPIGCEGQIQGTTGDNTGLMPTLRVFAGSTLIGSSDTEDAVSSITIDANGNWTLSHTFTAGQTYNLTMIATDGADNESRATVQFTAATSVTACFVGVTTQSPFATATVAGNSSIWYAKNFDFANNPNHIYGYVRLKLDGLQATMYDPNGNQLTPVNGVIYLNRNTTGFVVYFKLTNPTANTISTGLWSSIGLGN